MNTHYSELECNIDVSYEKAMSKLREKPFLRFIAKESGVYRIFYNETKHSFIIWGPFPCIMYCKSLLNYEMEIIQEMQLLRSFKN